MRPPRIRRNWSERKPSEGLNALLSHVLEPVEILPIPLNTFFQPNWFAKNDDKFPADASEYIAVRYKKETRLEYEVKRLPETLEIRCRTTGNTISVPRC